MGALGEQENTFLAVTKRKDPESDSYFLGGKKRVMTALQRERDGVERKVSLSSS